MVKLASGAIVNVIECGAPATGFFRYACVHEHVVEKWTCLEHHPRPGWVVCVQCLKAGHECEMRFTEIEPAR